MIGRITSIRSSNDAIGNRTRVLPVCSAVPKPNRPRPAPLINTQIWIQFRVHQFIKRSWIWFKFKKSIFFYTFVSILVIIRIAINYNDIYRWHSSDRYWDENLPSPFMTYFIPSVPFNPWSVSSTALNIIFFPVISVRTSFTILPCKFPFYDILK